MPIDVERDEIISRTELIDLIARNNAIAFWHVFLRVGFHFLTAAASYWAFTEENFALAIVALIPHAMAMSFLGWAGIGHEFFHNTVFKQKSINQFFFKWFSVLTWNNYGYFQETHPRHHKNTLAKDDAEGASVAPLTKIDMALLLSFDCVSFWRRVKVLCLNAAGIVPDSIKACFPEYSQAKRRLCVAARWVLGIQMVSMLIFVILEEWWLIVLVNLSPFMFTLPNKGLAFAQHFGLKGAGKWYFESCRTVILNPVIAFFYANMNYHVEHHFFPSVPYYRLHALHEKMRKRYHYPHIVHGIRQLVHQLYHDGLLQRKHDISA